LSIEAPVLLAIFVGGKSSRMGTPKGLLELPGASEPIIDALVCSGRQAGFEPVLVGDAMPYAQLAAGVPRIDDDPPGAGPLAGLQAAVRHASQSGFSRLIVVACDMPYVTSRTLAYIAAHPSPAPVLAARRGHDSPWEPMLARYDTARLAPVLDEAIAGGLRSFQQLFAQIEVEALPLTPGIARALEDWDTPEDLPR
jgi:molybdopterin-guanine dinucleotide biosynthesis protein A